MSTPAVCTIASSTITDLRNLHADLQLLIASFVDDPLDRVNLCLAFPTLGLAAQAALEPYREWLYHLAMELATGRVLVDDALLRWFAADLRAAADAAAWLNRVGTTMGATTRVARVELGLGPSAMLPPMLVQWLLMDVDVEGAPSNGSLVCETYDRTVVKEYEGEQGRERVLRITFPDGSVIHYEGERGHERKVRATCVAPLPDGTAIHYEGEPGHERQVRATVPDGTVVHYEGEPGHERMVRKSCPDGLGRPSDGTVRHFEGERGHERLVRIVNTDDTVLHFEGERPQERKVCKSLPFGPVLHYEGEQGQERKVLVVRPNGSVIHYEGERGQERKVLVAGMAWTDSRRGSDRLNVK